MNPNVNDNAIEEKKFGYTISLVDEEAKRLMNKYGNSKYMKFYCKAIYMIGLPRISELEGRVSDAKYPGRLLTKLLKEELQAIESHNRLRIMKNGG